MKVKKKGFKKMNDFLYSVYKWYSENSRDLPWRKTVDPYKIWISEIILQQTRVDQGISYYLKFVGRFPNIKKLAEAPEDEVLKLWQGLGYYSRARNLHSAAKQIIADYQGNFPSEYVQILNLKGVGHYTAAAISSIAFNLPYPALDGNIYRVLARYYGVFSPVNSGKGKKEFLKLANEIMPLENPGFHNQALMEFGALQCVPKSPDCLSCPVKASCYAACENKVAQLPVKTNKNTQRYRFFYYYFIDNGKDTWIEKRAGNDIWKSLYQFPLVETENELNEKEILSLSPTFVQGQNVNIKSVSFLQKHILSHQVIKARLIHLETDDNFNLQAPHVKIPKKNIFSFPVPRLMELFILKSGFFK